MKRLVVPGLMALSVLLTLACSLTSGIPTEEIRRRAIAILGDDIEEELVRDFIVVTPPPTFTVTPTPLACINPVSFGTYNLTVFNDQTGAADNPQFVYGPPDDRNAHWEGKADITRYWSYSLANVISGMITHTLVYTPDETVTSVDLYVHPDRFVSVDEPGWIRVCTGLWSCSFSAEVGSLMYALSAPGGVQVDGATIELTNGCEYAEAIAAANTPTPTLTPTNTPTPTVQISGDSAPTTQPDEQPTEAPTDAAAATSPPPTLALLPTLPPSPTLVPPSPTLPPPSPTLPPPTLPPPTAPPSSKPTDTPVPPTPTPLPVVALSAVSYSVAESGGSATITVILNTSSTLPVTVNYTTSDGTATAGSDYTTSSGTLTFSPGETSKSFSVLIQDDGGVEGDETVTLALSSPNNALMGSPNVATLTILDNDVPTVQFSSATYSVNESAGTATITVTLNVPPVLAATVNYAISDGTATVGSEYAASNGTLTFNPGQTSQSFSVTILNDLVIGEGNLVANLTLSNPTNATLGTPNPATLTMIDLCTLPDAILAANTDTATGDCGTGNGDDTITILLTGAINLTADLPNLSSNIVINGPGANSLTIDGGNSFNIFTVDPGNTVTIDAVTVSNSSSVGILNNGFLTVNNSVVSGNLGSADGGGIINAGGALTVINSTISSNSTIGNGGGIFNIDGTVTVDSSTISGNSANEGGGIYNDGGGTVNVTNSTISDNSASGGTQIDFLTKWGTAGAGDGQFNAPNFLDVDSANNVYVTEWNNDRVQKFDSNGNFLAKWGTLGTGDGQFNAPAGIAIDSADNIYVVDQSNNRIQKFDSNGTFLTKWGTFGTGDGQFSGPWGIGVDGANNIYVADYGNDRIQKFDSNGNFLLKWGTAGAGDGQFSLPADVGADSAGDIYVSDELNHRVQKFDSNGNFLTKWGTNGTADGQFNNSVGVAVDGFDNIYVGDWNNNRIQQFDGSGTFLTKWGTLGTGDGQFAGPIGVAIDDAEYIYVSDRGNNRVQKFTRDGGGGIRNASGTVTLMNTIVANSLSGGDCSNSGTIVDNGFNLIEDGTCGFAIGGDPNLGPLQNNGGTTPTHALLGGSSAIDAGSCAGTTADQRGLPRPVDRPPANADDGCDIGAFEVQ